MSKAPFQPGQKFHSDYMKKVTMYSVITPRKEGYMFKRWTGGTNYARAKRSASSGGWRLEIMPV